MLHNVHILYNSNTAKRIICIILTKTTVVKYEGAHCYHRVRGLCLLAVTFCGEFDMYMDRTIKHTYTENAFIIMYIAGTVKRTYHLLK